MFSSLDIGGSANLWISDSAFLNGECRGLCCGTFLFTLCLFLLITLLITFLQNMLNISKKVVFLRRRNSKRNRDGKSISIKTRNV